MATTITKTFEFGPGTGRPRSNMRTFSAPAGSNVKVKIKDMSTDGGTIAVLIELREASATSVGAPGPDGPIAETILVPATSSVATFPKTYTSTFGCPSTWRVRVRTSDGSNPPAKVSGTIVFEFTPPSAVVLDMTGSDTQHLDPNVVANRTLRARVGSVNAIDGTGEFHIKAKWHTDVVHGLFQYDKLTVALLKPNGTVAMSETGYSQHAPDEIDNKRISKMDFRYTVTPQDALMGGDWGLRITNNSDRRVVEFDINRGGDLNSNEFKSTFQANCG